MRTRRKPYRVNYMVSRTVREPHCAKRIETRNGHLRTTIDWDSDAGHKRLRQFIADANPGWHVGGYAACAPRKRTNSIRSVFPPGPPYRIHSVVSGRMTTAEGFKEDLHKLERFHREAVNNALEVTTRQVFQELDDDMRKLAKIPGVRVTSVDDARIVECDFAEAERKVAAYFALRFKASK